MFRSLGNLISPRCNPEINKKYTSRVSLPRQARRTTKFRYVPRCFGVSRGRGIFQFPVAISRRSYFAQPRDTGLISVRRGRIR